MWQNFTYFSSHKSEKINLNFKEFRKGKLISLDSTIDSRFIKQYYDEYNAVVLTIFKSGWRGRYHCILEWGEFEDTDHKLYSSIEIYEHYGINTFLRKEKLDKINEL
jgi:hypothetical protein